MSGMNFLEKLLDGAAVEWKPLVEVVLSTSNIKWKNTDRVSHSSPDSAVQRARAAASR